jgi:hypothetical protein
MNLTKKLWEKVADQIEEDYRIGDLNALYYLIDGLPQSRIKRYLAAYRASIRERWANDEIFEGYPPPLPGNVGLCVTCGEYWGKDFLKDSICADCRELNK